MRLNMWKHGPDFLYNENPGAGAGGEGGTGGTEHPVSAPWGAEGVWKLGEGEQAKEWWNSLPDEVARKHVEAKQYANPAELALANYNLTKMHTDANAVSIPAADAALEAWNEFYTKLGRPESADKYDLKFGEGVQTDEGMVKFGKELFFEMGLPQGKAQAAADKWNAFVATQNAAALEADNARNGQEIEALKTSWGAELDANVAAGKLAVNALGLTADKIERIEASIGSAAVVELMALIGKKAGEGTGFVAGGGQYDANNPDTMTKEQAAARVTQLQGDVEFQKKYNTKTHPEHADAVKLMERLYAKA